MLKLKKFVPNTPKPQQSKPSSQTEPFMDTELEIRDPFFTLNLLDLCFAFYGSHLNKEYPFRVVELGLYYSITPTVYLFPEFVSWIMATYIKEENCCIPSIGEKILEVTPKLIQNSFIYPKFPNLERFT